MDAAYGRLRLLTDSSAVHQAMAEHDAVGRDAFLAKYGFGPAREYVVVEGGREYDSKAIAGAALAYQDGVHQALPRTAFSGGSQGAAGWLRAWGSRSSGAGSPASSNS
jgi:5-methylcytosine-specific restriction protein A